MTGRGGVGGKGPRQMGSHAGGADDHAESRSRADLANSAAWVGVRWSAEDMGLIGDVQGVQLGTGPFDHGQSLSLPMMTATFFHRKRSFLRLRVFSA